jgi:arabinose-5-phosphate isomerase
VESVSESLPSTPPPFDAERALRMAARTFEIEARALLDLAARQDRGFADAVRAMLHCRGRIVVMGMGKSGHVGRKIAATLASTGTPAFFVHPAEASHGDLGMVQPGDVVLAISNSGDSDELAAILPALRRIGVVLVAMCGKAESTLARHADFLMSSAVAEEACPLNLAPTASTTAQMALGDALAVALLDARGFREEDFARSHPGGALGRKLLMHVHDLMRSGDAVPRVLCAASTFGRCGHRASACRRRCFSPGSRAPPAWPAAAATPASPGSTSRAESPAGCRPVRRAARYRTSPGRA